MPVSVKGVVELRKALRAYSPDLAKSLTQELGAALKPVVKQARGYLPSNSQVISNWQGSLQRSDGRFPQYDQTVARRGISYNTTPTKANRKGFKSLVTIRNKSAAGAIYETAGRVNPNSIFVQNQDHKKFGAMKGKGDMRGRAIFRAWDEDQGKARDGVMRAIEKASATFRARSKVNE